MSFFSQKKKTTSQLRPLSENEIQKKLYGNLRPELLNRQRSAQPSQSQPQPSLSFTQPPVMVKTAPEQAPSPSAVRDLFDAASPIPADSTLTENLQPQTIKKEKTAEKSRLERLAQLAEIEKPAKNKPLRNDPWKKKSILPVLDFSGAGKFAQGIGGKTAGVLGSAGKGLLGVFVVGVAFGMRLLHAFDLRKPAVRRVIYWLAGAAALFSIFMGIHLLNVRREEAMKAPPKAAAKTVKKETPEKKAAASDSKKTPTVAVKADKEVLTPVAAETAAPRKTEAVQAASQGSASAAVPAAGTGRYVIQIATFAGPNDAERVQKSLKAAQLPVFVKALTRPSGRVYYSVFMGRYGSFDEAQQGFDLFRKNDAGKSFQDAFIRTID